MRLVSLLLIGWLTGLAHAAPPRPSRAKERPYGPITLYAPLRGERLKFRPYDDRGLPRKGARAELSRFLRCPHTGAQRPVDARLVPVLYRMGRHFGREVVIYSGYRPPQLSTVRRSRHLTAAAIDFRIPGVDNQALVRFLRRAFHPLGVGFYPDGVHVHLDVDRARDTFWIQRGSDHRPLAMLGSLRDSRARHVSPPLAR